MLEKRISKFTDRLVASNPPPYTGGRQGGGYYEERDVRTLIKLAYRAGYAAHRDKSNPKKGTPCPTTTAGKA